MAFRNERGGWRTLHNFGTIEGIDVGKVNFALGTDDRDEAEAIEAMLDDLPNFGIHGAALLVDIARKRRKAVDVYRTIYKQHRVREVSAVITEKTLTTAWADFIKNARRKNGLPLSERTKRDYADYINRLTAINPNASVRDLPAVLTAYREQAVVAGHFQTFNKVQAACQSFVRNTEPDRQYSELWRQVSKIDGCPSEKQKAPSALPVWEVVELIGRLPQERMRNIAWTLMLTGMRIAEYWGHWEDEGKWICIHGTKSKAADRKAPKLTEHTLIPEPFHYFQMGGRNHVRPGEPAIEYNKFKTALKVAANDKDFSPHAFRHSYKGWLEDAAIPKPRRDVYMGHAALTLEDLYGRAKAETFLEPDTKDIVAFLEANWKRPKASKAKPKLLKIA